MDTASQVRIKSTDLILEDPKKFPVPESCSHSYQCKPAQRYCLQHVRVSCCPSMLQGLLVNALSVISTPRLISWATCLPPCLQLWALIRSPIRTHLIRYESYSLLGGDSHSSQSCCGGPWVSQGRVKSRSCSSQKIF